MNTSIREPNMIIERVEAIAPTIVSFPAKKPHDGSSPMSPIVSSEVLRDVPAIAHDQDRRSPFPTGDPFMEASLYAIENVERSTRAPAVQPAAHGVALG